MKKKIYLGILFLVFFACFFGLQNQKKTTRYSPIAAQNPNNNDARILGLNASFPVSADLQKRYQQAFVHDFVMASVQPAEAKDLVLRVRMNRHHRLRIVTLKSSGLFQLDQVARNTVETRPYWLEADRTYDLHFQYDPNWDRGEFENNQKRLSADSQDLHAETSQSSGSQTATESPFPQQKYSTSNLPEHSQTRSESVHSGKSFNIAQYQAAAVAKIHRFYHPPEGFENSYVVAQFIVNQSGTIDNLHIIRSSSIPSVDAALLQSIRLAAPFSAHSLRTYPMIVTMGKRQSSSVSSEMKNYTKLLREKINPNWYSPVVIEQQRVLVQFMLSDAGKPYQVRILSSSGDPRIDASAINAIVLANNLPPLPPSMRGRQNRFVWIFDKHTHEQ